MAVGMEEERFLTWKHSGSEHAQALHAGLFVEEP